jgi:hypothetical protein
MPALFSGPSITATGTITSNTASLLTLASGCKRGCITNISGKRAYLKIDDAASPTVSATVYDIALEDKEKITWDDQVIKTVGVYVEATSGVNVVGWPN